MRSGWQYVGWIALLLSTHPGCSPDDDGDDTKPREDVDDPTETPTPGTPGPTPTDTTPGPGGTPGPGDSPDPDETPDPGPTPTPQPVTLTLEGDLEPEVPLSARFQVTATPAASIVLRCEQPGNDTERHRISSPLAAAHDLTLRGLKAATSYTCHAEATQGASGSSSTVSFTTAPLPDDLGTPAVVVATDDPARTGYIITSVATITGTSSFERRYLVIVDPFGNVRWYLKDVGGGDTDVSFLGDDRLLYGGWGGEAFPPTILGLDGEVRFEGTSEVSSPTEVAGSFHHDAGLSAEGSSIFFLTHQMVDDLWEGYLVKEVDLETNRILWSWDAFVDGAQLDVFPPGNSADRDPYHANTVFDQWENGRLFLYVSMRNLNQVIKIDYLSRAVVWVLGVDGDFDLVEADGSPAGDDRWFFFQHDVKAVGNRLYLYDNGTERNQHGGEAYSRALELEIDEGTMTARIVSEYAEAGWSEPVWGGYDPLPDDHALLAIGHCWACELDGDILGDERNSALIELDASRKVVWRANFPDSKVGIYRAERIDGCELFHLEALCGAPRR